MRRTLQFLITMLVIISISLTGCSAEKSENDMINVTPTAVTLQASILEKITAEEAKKMMDERTDIIILDVRTEDEFNEGHIEGAILIPDYEIAEKADELLKDKNATILIYCRSGRRSDLAAQILSDLDYTEIYDFGGIIDWPYDIVTE